MGRAIGITEFLTKKFITYPLEGVWKAHLGLPERNFNMLVYGHSGAGKTDYVVKLSKELSPFARILYNSSEEGISATLQEAFIRNNMEQVKGRIILVNDNFKDMVERLKKKASPMIVIIDSRDYMNLSTEQFKSLKKLFPRKAFIITCWESGGKPKSQHAKDIEYMCDIKVRVARFKAHPRSRFGGNSIFTIWDKKATSGQQVEIEFKISTKNH